jgi:hypothetical protein
MQIGGRSHARMVPSLTVSGQAIERNSRAHGIWLCSPRLPVAVGDHVFRVQLKASHGKFLTVDSNHFLLPRGDTAGPDTIFELHRVTPGPAPRYAIRSPLGKFLNVDESIELAIKDKAAKDTGIKLDRDGGEAGAALTARETSFELIHVGGDVRSGDEVVIRVPGDEGYYLSVEPQPDVKGVPVEAKVKLARNTSNIAAAVVAPTHGRTGSQISVSEHRRTTSSKSGTSTPEPATPKSGAGASAAESDLVFVPTPNSTFTVRWVDERSPFSLAGPHLLKTWLNLLWVADPSVQHLVANRVEFILWESLVIKPVSLTHVMLQPQHQSKYITYEKIGRHRLLCSNEEGDDSRFELIPVDVVKGAYAFKASNGLFVCAQGNHTLTASSKEIGPWETMTLTPAPTITQ